MKAIKFTVALLILGLCLTFAPQQSVYAQSPAYETSFRTAITYQNVGNAAATISVQFYNENNSTPITLTRPDLAAGAGTSLFLGSLNEISSGFKGSAVLSSNQALVATMVQVPSSTTVKNRPLANGFMGSDGATSYLIASVLKNKFNTNSVFSAQNVTSSPVNLTIKFFDAANPSAAPIEVTHSNLPAGAAKYYDMGQVSQVPDGFNGSAVIESTGNIVAAAQELSTNGTNASSFEGIASGGNTVYMASALCGAFGTNSAYAIQNTSQSATANVTVEFTMKAVGGTTVTTSSATGSIAPGAKMSIRGCNPADNPQGWTVSGGGNPDNTSGSAKITSTGAEIVALGKVSGGGRSTAFIGSTSGAATLACPYVRWSETKFTTGQYQRGSLAIQNVGSSDVSNVQVEYRNKNGELVGTDTIASIAAGGKGNSKPSNVGAAANEFGQPEGNPGGGFGGGAVIKGPAGSQLIATVRISSKVPAADQTVAEDYNCIPIQ